MDNIIVLAKSKACISDNDENDILFTEWGVGEISSDDDKNELVKRYSCREIYGYRTVFLSLRRRVKKINNDTEYSDWDILDFWPSQFSAAKMICDTAYWESESLSELHKKVCLWRKRKISLRDEEVRLIKTKNSLEQIYQDEYILRLKEKRLYRKARNNNAPKDIITEIKKDLKERYLNEKSVLEDRLKQIEIESEEMKKENEYFSNN